MRTLRNVMLILTFGIISVGILSAQPDATPERLIWEKDWTVWEKSREKPEEVTKLLIEDLDDFDPSVLESYSRLEGLIILGTSLPNLDWLQYTPYLKVLEIHGNGLKSLEGIQSMEHLRELSVNHNFIKDISPLLELPELTLLRIYDNEVKDVSVLAESYKLLHLELGRNPIESIDSLANLTDLRYFSVYKCSLITDLEPIREMKYLTELNISFVDIPDFSLEIVAPMKDLESLRIQGMVKHNDELQHLAGLTKLTQLTMGINDAVDDLSVLSDLTEMAYLDIHSNNVMNIEVVRNYPKLVKLVMYKNLIEDLSPLQDCPEIRSLFIYDNIIDDYSVLQELKSLQYLEVDKQEFSAEERHALKLALPNCRISGW